MAVPTLPHSPSTPEDFRERSARILLELWRHDEKLAEQACELTRPKPDPLKVALNGLPDVNSYYAYDAGAKDEVD